MPKSILIATGIYPPQIGGPATYSKLLYDTLPKMGYETRVANFGDFLIFPKLIRHALYFFRVFALAIGAGVIYAQDPVSVGLPSLIAAKILGKRFILKVVGDYAWEQYSQINLGAPSKSLDDFQIGHFDWKTELRKKVQFYVARHAEAIIVPSNYLRKIVSGWGISPGKISLVYNTFNPPRIAVSREKARRKLGLHGTVILSAGRLVPWKGFSSVIDSMPRVIENIPDARFYIIGDGPEKSKIKSQISNLGLGERILLLGKLSQDILFQYLVAADIFVLNTAYEGFSHQILEAMAFGVPVITTNVGGNAEIIENGINGMLVSLNDKEDIAKSVVKLSVNEELKKDMVAKAKIKAGTFSEERMLESLVKIFK